MIRKNTINCKLAQLKILKKSGFDCYTDAMGVFRIQDEVCPTCGCRGGCTPHGGYERYLIDFHGGTRKCYRIHIKRLLCTCGATHAVLPDPIIPYDQYSLLYILVVLAVYFCRLLTVECICEIYEISPALLYRWSGIYGAQRKEWEGLLRSIEADIRKSLFELVRKEPYSAFAAFFIRTTSSSFLQTHANPANCRRNLQYAFSPGGSHTTCEYPPVT